MIRMWISQGKALQANKTGSGTTSKQEQCGRRRTRKPVWLMSNEQRVAISEMVKVNDTTALDPYMYCEKFGFYSQDEYM